MPSRDRSQAAAAGFTLPELLLAATLVGLLACLAVGEGSRSLARLRLESAARRVVLGLEMGRVAAERRGGPCGLQLSEAGWQAPPQGELPPCDGVALPLQEGFGTAELSLEHNLPEQVLFSANGLLLDGGTVLLRHPGLDLVRCVVVSLPLGVVRHGLLGEAGCLPEPLRR
jgi:prepilin-type N-terminal cleavage/methylation domain-containing protein